MKIKLILLNLMLFQFITQAQNCSFIEDLNTSNNSITFIATDTLSVYNYLFIVDSTVVLNNLTGGHSATYQGFVNDTLPHNICFKIVDLINQVLICENCTTFSMVPTIPPSPSCAFTYYFSNDTLYAAQSGSVTPADYVWNVNGNLYGGAQLTLFVGNIDSVLVSLNGQNITLGTSCINQQYVFNPGFIPPTVNHCNTDFANVSNGLTSYFIDITSNNNPLQSVYYWNFGDGNFSSDRNVQHTYNTDGDYNVCLWVKDTIDNTHCNDTICKLITVSSILPIADSCNAFFVFTQIQSFSIGAINLTSGLNPVFSWNFGDGPQSIVAGPYPSYTYINPGTYEVCLSISTDSCSNTYCDSLTVDTAGIMRGGGQEGFTVNVLSPTQLTSVNELQAEKSEVNNILVYPNPSTGVFMISKSANIEVYNLMGALILSEINVRSIDLTDKPKGVYFVKMNGSVIKKLIKN